MKTPASKCYHCSHFRLEPADLNPGVAYLACKRDRWRVGRPPVGSDAIQIRGRRDFQRVSDAATHCPDFKDVFQASRPDPTPPTDRAINPPVRAHQQRLGAPSTPTSNPRGIGATSHCDSAGNGGAPQGGRRASMASAPSASFSHEPSRRPR